MDAVGKIKIPNFSIGFVSAVALKIITMINITSAAVLKKLKFIPDSNEYRSRRINPWKAAANRVMEMKTLFSGHLLESLPITRERAIKQVITR